MNTALAELDLRISLIDLAKARNEVAHLFLQLKLEAIQLKLEAIDETNPNPWISTGFVAPGAG